MRFLAILLAIIAYVSAQTTTACTVCSYVAEVAELAIKYEGFNTTATENLLDQVCSLPVIVSYKAECEALIAAEAGPLAKCLCAGSPADQCCAMVDACKTTNAPLKQKVGHLFKAAKKLH